MKTILPRAFDNEPLNLPPDRLLPSTPQPCAICQHCYAGFCPMAKSVGVSSWRAIHAAPTARLVHSRSIDLLRKSGHFVAETA